MKRKCQDCGGLCYGWANGPFARCPYRGSFDLEQVEQKSRREVMQAEKQPASHPVAEPRRAGLRGKGLAIPENR